MHIVYKKHFICEVNEVDGLTIDTSQIEQVIINLVKNATYALQDCKEPQIEIKAYSKAGKKVIEVTDNGAGIPEKEKKEIFVPFFSTKKEGSGIGLSLSKQIMHLHNGNITFSSEEGNGTSFYLVFRD